MLNFTGCPRLTIAAASIGVVKHEVYDDKRKTGKDAGELRVVPGTIDMSKPVQSTQESAIRPVSIGEIIVATTHPKGPRHERR